MAWYSHVTEGFCSRSSARKASRKKTPNITTNSSGYVYISRTYPLMYTPGSAEGCREGYIRMYPVFIVCVQRLLHQYSLVMGGIVSLPPRSTTLAEWMKWLLLFCFIFPVSLFFFCSFFFLFKKKNLFPRVAPEGERRWSWCTSPCPTRSVSWVSYVRTLWNFYRLSWGTLLLSCLPNSTTSFSVDHSEILARRK